MFLQPFPHLSGARSPPRNVGRSSAIAGRFPALPPGGCWSGHWASRQEAPLPGAMPSVVEGNCRMFKSLNFWCVFSNFFVVAFGFPDFFLARHEPCRPDAVRAWKPNVGTMMCWLYTYLLHNKALGTMHIIQWCKNLTFSSRRWPSMISHHMPRYRTFFIPWSPIYLTIINSWITVSDSNISAFWLNVKFCSILKIIHMCYWRQKNS